MLINPIAYRNEYNQLDISISFARYSKIRQQYPDKPIEALLKLFINKSQVEPTVIDESIALKKIVLKTPYQFAKYIEKLNENPYEFKRLLGEASWYIKQCGDVKTAAYYLLKFEHEVSAPKQFGFHYVWGCVKRWKETEKEFRYIEETKIIKNKLFTIDKK